MNSGRWRERAIAKGFQPVDVLAATINRYEVSPFVFTDLTPDWIDAVATLVRERVAGSRALHPLSFVAPDPLIGAGRRHYVVILSAGIDDDPEEHKSYWATLQEVVDQVRLTLKLPASKIGKKRWYKRLGPWLKAHTPSWKELKDAPNDTGLLVVGGMYHHGVGSRFQH